jgi:hypothetical protein
MNEAAPLNCEEPPLSRPHPGEPEVSGLDQLERPAIATADAQVSSWHTCRTAGSRLAGAALPPGGDPVDTRPHLGAQARGK